MTPPKLELNPEQKQALHLLEGQSNVFLTGAAGSGKSFLIRQFLRDKDPKATPVLASTGAAAILVGGRTFHSFFGLGIMEGGIQATVERALKNKRLTRRLKETEGFVIDEVSMISASAFQAAETIARKARERDAPWGGLRVVAVGDFAQLPPVNPFKKEKEWAFLDPSWHATEFSPVVFGEIMRTKEKRFLEVLNDVRNGVVSGRVKDFLKSRVIPIPDFFEGTRLFARKMDVEALNLEKLSRINAPVKIFETEYSGSSKAIEDFKKNAPIPEVIHLKKGALVMLRQNDVLGKWVNGSLGHITNIGEALLEIELLSGRTVEVEKTSFTLLNADGESVAAATNFPVTLAYALTIHKTQGTTLDKMTVDLRNLWEPGQAYVALSRALSSDGLFVEGFSPSSIFVDPLVAKFHAGITL